MSLDYVTEKLSHLGPGIAFKCTLIVNCFIQRHRHIPTQIPLLSVLALGAGENTFRKEFDLKKLLCI